VITDELDQKLSRLRNIISDLGSVLVAFSGGVDSTLLLCVARQVLNDEVKAATAVSPTFPSWERKEAEATAKELGAKLIVFESSELEQEQFCRNPENRCYFCKRELFQKLKAIAKKQKLKYVAEASNLDDLSDYRPGRKAIEEIGIKSPLLDAQLSKAEIREASRRLGLKTFDKPGFACLASRFPYGERITKEKLAKVEQAENILRETGFKIFRVRYHREVARIELDRQEIERMLSDRKLCEKIYAEFQTIGFLYTSLDLLGYRTGSMNLTIRPPKQRKW